MSQSRKAIIANKLTSPSKLNKSCYRYKLLNVNNHSKTSASHRITILNISS